jgi:tetratricopeptide (TPR) repeat protein
MPPSDDTAPATGLLETPGDYGFPPGARVGRYVLGERLGAGGMGIVYAAHDPKLDRSVALKLLRPDASGDSEAHRQLLREAQTLARLAHPNVVNVHDIGEVEGRIYVDMELVKGGTLGRWLAQGGHTWKQVLEVFVQAGRGLAAAHALGIVHRDFKPDNVLVGDDGRVRVADFGIALLGPQPHPASQPGGPHPAAAAAVGPSAREVSGNANTPQPVVFSPPGADGGRARAVGWTGTPAYMAPEQRRDGTADARSDQYSFAMALREAVTGRADKPPSWLLQAVERALSDEPAQRFASMEALVDALESEPRRRGRRRRSISMAIGAAALLCVGVGWGSVRGKASAPKACRGAETTVAGVWGPAEHATVQRAFLASGKPFAADAWRGVETSLDAYARDWAAARTEACEATRVRGEQSDQILTLRTACLDERLSAMHALVGVLEHADDGVVLHGFGATQALPRMASCSDASWLLARVKPPTDPATAAKVADLRDRLAQTKALDDSAKYPDALALAKGIEEEAAASGDAPVHAASLYALGSLLGRTGDLAGAERTLRQAASVADSAGDDATRVRAWGGLLYYVGNEGHRADLIDTFVAQAQGALARLGHDSEVEGSFLEDEGSALQSAGRLAEARKAEERAVALDAEAFGSDSWQQAVALTNLGIALASAGESAQAITVLQRALAINERAVGPAHPYVASAENAIAGVFMSQGSPELAEPHAQRAALLGEGVVSGEELGRFRYDLASVQQAAGNLDGALASYQQALKDASTSFASDDPALRDYLRSIGETYVDLGQPKAALPYLERALKLVGGPDAELAQAQFAMARALYDAGSDRPRARALAQQARKAFESAEAGPDATAHKDEIDAWLKQPGHGSKR